MKGNRRLIFLGVLLVVSSVNLYFGKLMGTEWTELWLYLGAAYLGSDGVEKGASAWKGRPPAVIQAASPAGGGE